MASVSLLLPAAVRLFVQLPKTREKLANAFYFGITISGLLVFEALKDIS